MQVPTLILLVLFSIFSSPSNAQDKLPKGFKSGSILLADSTSISGSIKENISYNASVIIIDLQGKKKTYSGSQLLGLMIDGKQYRCFRGDFFKIIADGNLSFLQKASDASNIPTYNGTEAVFTNGTEGRPGDYFLYNQTSKQLRLVSKKNFNESTTAAFAGNDAALNKARSLNGDLTLLQEAVTIYNSGVN